MTKDTVRDLSKAILRLLSDRKLYLDLATRAEKIGKDNVWENVYANAFKEMHRVNKE